MTFAKLLAKPLSAADQANLVTQAVALILQKTNPTRIFLFGSAGRSEMTDYSDLDLALVFEDSNAVKLARKSGVFSISGVLNWPCDLLLFDKLTFETNSEIGGVCQIIKEEGRVLFEQGDEFGTKK